MTDNLHDAENAEQTAPLPLLVKTFAAVISVTITALIGLSVATFAGFEMKNRKPPGGRDL